MNAVAEVANLREAGFPVGGSPRDYDPLMEWIGSAGIVLLGESTHGTHEFHRERSRITRRLIAEKGFNAVAVEADWPDAWRVNQYIDGAGEDRHAAEALGAFRRFPSWMWRNADMLNFVGWLRDHNDQRAPGERTGFYGLDLYSLHASIQMVLAYLNKVDPVAARRARSRYSCFEHYGQDPHAYGLSVARGELESCEEEVVTQLLQLRRRAADYVARNGDIAADQYFFAEQNARLVKNAERYYRAIFRDRATSWNLRDEHMADTLEALRKHLQRKQREPKIVVWEHNAHLGDARATQMAERGELSVGQLVRERNAGNCILVGFTTYQGSVTAAPEWGAAPQRFPLRPALPESVEAVLHQAGRGDILLHRRALADNPLLAEPLLQRGVGVIYRPDTERFSHYCRAHLPGQFDAVVHLDRTRAVEPLESVEDRPREETETFRSTVEAL
jgi:erythromycin esterase-like protein